MKKIDFIKQKIVTKPTLSKKLAVLRLYGKTVVFTNGCFDILHQGHIKYLSETADCGNALIVGINSDNSLKKLGKGVNRPIQDEYSRALIVASLHFVDAVIVFDEDTPYELIKLIQPDVLVKGGDWKINDIVGADIVKAKEGEVKTIPYIEGFSTTNIEKKIKNS